MAQTTIKLGTSSGSLVTLPHYPSKGSPVLSTTRTTKEIQTDAGDLNISVRGKTRRTWVIKYQNLKHADLVTLQSYESARKWWCEISGFGTTKLAESWCYFELDKTITPQIIYDNDILYSTTAYIKLIKLT